jgi:hypothetical protein
MTYLLLGVVWLVVLAVVLRQQRRRTHQDPDKLAALRRIEDVRLAEELPEEPPA